MAKKKNKDQTCSIEGCEKKVFCKSLCCMHYTRLYKHGNVEFGKKIDCDYQTTKKLLQEMKLLQGKWDYNKIKLVAKKLHVKVENFQTNSPDSDPFYSGTKGRIKDAKWFQTVWQKYNPNNTKIHLRRFYYLLISQKEKIELPKPINVHNRKVNYFEHIDECWLFLLNASRHARNQHLIDESKIEDRKNPEPNVFINYKDYSYRGCNVGYEMDLDEFEYYRPLIDTGKIKITYDNIEHPAFNLYSIFVKDLEKFVEGNLTLPEVFATGYRYSELEDQPYHIELWIEKSTMNDILLPLCEKLGINYVTSEGINSITSVINFFQRIRQTNRPIRVFYISDFDPAGDIMPIAVANRIAYWKQEYNIKNEIKLKHLALTEKQVEEYDLPEIPIKASDIRKDNFSKRHNGKLATELDALEALYPGKLAELVEDEISQYIDDDIEYRIDRANNVTQENLEEQLNDAVQYEVDEFKNLNESAEETDIQIKKIINPVIENTQEKLDEIYEKAKKERDLILKLYDEKIRPKVDKLNEKLETEVNNLANEANEELDNNEYLTDLREEVEDDENLADNLLFDIQSRLKNIDFNALDIPESELEIPDESEWLYNSNRDFISQLKYFNDRKIGEK